MMVKGALIAASVGAWVAVPVHADAANARTPYANIDPRVDAGNDTGDSQVDRLNEAQLDRPATQRHYGQNYARPSPHGQYSGYAQVPPGNYAAQAYSPRYAPYPYAPPPGYQPAPYGGAPYPGSYPQY